MSKLKLAVLASSQLNVETVMQEQKESIKKALEEYSVADTVLVIGNIKNALLLQYVESLGYEVIKKIQHSRGIGNSNKNIINTSDKVLFFHYKESESITYFIEYAQKNSTEDKMCVVSLS